MILLTYLYNAPVMIATSVPFNRLNGATAKATKENTFVMELFIAVPNAISESIGIPNNSAYLGSK